jgi:RES domain-containing protein
MDILETIAATIDQVDKWREDETGGPFGIWRNQRVQIMDEPTEAAIDGLGEALKQTDFPRDVWHTVVAADAFVEQWERLKRDQQMPVPKMHPAGEPALWNAYARMTDAQAPYRRIYAKPGPIAQYFRQKLSPNQIARIYAWSSPNGAPDTRKVFEEHTKPGTHYDDSNWIHPEDAVAERNREAEWSIRAARVETVIRAEAPSPAASESLESLVILPNMSARQIRKMLPDATDDEIFASAEAMGVRLPERPGTDLSKPVGIAAREAAWDEERQEEAIQSETAQGINEALSDAPIETRIFALSDGGLKPGQIASLLAEEGLEYTPQKIGRMIAARTRETAGK